MTSPESKRKLRDLEAAAAREEARERMFKQFQIKQDQIAAALRYPFVRHSELSDAYTYAADGKRVNIGDRMHSPYGIVVVVPDHGELTAPMGGNPVLVVAKEVGGDPVVAEDNMPFWLPPGVLMHEFTDLDSIEEYLEPF